MVWITHWSQPETEKCCKEHMNFQSCTYRGREVILCTQTHLVVGQGLLRSQPPVNAASLIWWTHGAGFPPPTRSKSPFGSSAHRSLPRPHQILGTVIWSAFSASSPSDPSIRLNPGARGDAPGVEELRREGRCSRAGAVCLPHMPGRWWSGEVRFVTCQAISSLRGENHCGSFKPWAARGRQRLPFAEWQRVN